MIVKDTVIQKMFIEEKTPNDLISISDADTNLNHFNADTKSTESIVILGKSSCPFCKKTKELLDAKELSCE